MYILSYLHIYLINIIQCCVHSCIYIMLYAQIYISCYIYTYSVNVDRHKWRESTFSRASSWDSQRAALTWQKTKKKILRSQYLVHFVCNSDIWSTFENFYPPKRNRAWHMEDLSKFLDGVLFFLVKKFTPRKATAHGARRHQLHLRRVFGVPIMYVCMYVCMYIRIKAPPL